MAIERRGYWMVDILPSILHISPLSYNIFEFTYNIMVDMDSSSSRGNKQGKIL